MKTATELLAIAMLQRSKTKVQLLMDKMVEAAGRGELSYELSIRPDEQEIVDAFVALGLHVASDFTYTPNLRGVTLGWWKKPAVNGSKQ